MWRTFIGMWDDGDPDWTSAEEFFRDWSDARDWMAARLARWVGDECDTCEARAAEESARMLAAKPDTEWFGEVEGDDYLIVAVSSEVPRADYRNML